MKSLAEQYGVERPEITLVTDGAADITLSAADLDGVVLNALVVERQNHALAALLEASGGLTIQGL